MTWDTAYREYRDAMLNSRVQYKMQQLGDHAYLSYVTARGAIKYITDVQNYLFGLCEHGGKPSDWDSLVRRAKRRGFYSHLSVLRATFVRERDLHSRYAVESLDEFEFNQRKGLQ